MQAWIPWPGSPLLTLRHVAIIDFLCSFNLIELVLRKDLSILVKYSVQVAHESSTGLSASA